MIIIILACHEITVSGTLEHSLMEGKYIRTAEQGCGGKSSWKHESGRFFLYEIEMHSEGIHDRWVLGDDYCSNVASKFPHGFWTSTMISFLVFLLPVPIVKSSGFSAIAAKAWSYHAVVIVSMFSITCISHSCIGAVSVLPLWPTNFVKLLVLIHRPWP